MERDTRIRIVALDLDGTLLDSQKRLSDANREALARAAAAVGIDGLFLETHPEPEKALSDGANSLPTDQLYNLLTIVKDIHGLVKQM